MIRDVGRGCAFHRVIDVVAERVSATAEIVSALPGVESVKVLISDEIAILLPLMSGRLVMIA